MRRRDFSALLCAAAAWPTAGRAQQALPLVVFFNGQSAPEAATYVSAFHEGLNAAGFVDARNVAVEYVYANGNREVLPRIAAELVARRVSVIMTAGGTPVTIAA